MSNYTIGYEHPSEINCYSQNNKYMFYNTEEESKNLNNTKQNEQKTDPYFINNNTNTVYENYDNLKLEDNSNK